MIGIHHPLSIQIGESTLSSATMTLVLLYELLPDMGESSLTKMELYNRYLIWLKYHVKEAYDLQLAILSLQRIQFIRSTLYYKFEIN